MKLKFLGIIACALAFCFVLVGCNSQKTTDFTWYQAAVPDKYELNTSLGNNAAKVSFAKTDPRQLERRKGCSGNYPSIHGMGRYRL